MMANMKKFALALVFSLLVSTAFAATDVSKMKRSDIISLLFVKGTTAEVNDGFGVTGKLQNGLDVVLGGVLVAMQSSTGGNYTVGDTVKVTTSDVTATAWFSVNMDETKSETPEIVEIAAKDLATAADLTKHFTVKSTGTYGEIVAEVPANVKFTVNTTWTAVSTVKGNLAAGDSYTTGSDAEVTTWWPKVEDDDESDSDGKVVPKITEISAEELISAEDLARYFKTSQGKDGEVIAEVPAYTRFTVPESWAAVSTGKGNILAGDVYETGQFEERTSWWVNPAYWEAENSVEVSTKNLDQFLSLQGELNEGSLWKIYGLKEEAKGKILSTPLTSDLVMVVRKGGEIQVSDVADEATEEILIASRAAIANVDGHMFDSTDGVEAADPAGAQISAENDGEQEVVWYCASDKLTLTGKNLKTAAWYEKSGRYILTDKDGNTVQKPKDGAWDGCVLSTTDGEPIATLTVYLYKATSGNGGESNTSGGGSGGGGCNSGLSALALVLLPFIFKGRKSN